MAVTSTPRRRRRKFSDQGQNVMTKQQFLANFVTEVKTAQLSGSKWRQCDFCELAGNGATFNKKAMTARLKSNYSRYLQPKWKRFKFFNQ